MYLLNINLSIFLLRIKLEKDIEEVYFMKNMRFDYDLKNDSLFLCLDEEGYEFSEFLTDTIAMDFKTEKVPIGIKIFKGSEKFNTKKDNLMNIIKDIADVSIGRRKD